MRLPYGSFCRTGVLFFRGCCRRGFENKKVCRECAYVDRCTGGCRNSVLMQGDDYYGIDEDLCYFYENGWEERLTKAAEEPFAAYLKRNPPKKSSAPDEIAEDMSECP